MPTVLIHSRRVTVSLLLVTACGRDTASRNDSAQSAGPPAWMLDRGAQEAQLAAESPAFHDFRFTDRVAETGITFTMRAVDDATKAYKPMHYDHGTAVAAADVDRDGRPDILFVNQLGTTELWKNLGGGSSATSRETRASRSRMTSVSAHRSATSTTMAIPISS